MRILVIEDEPKTGDYLLRGLAESGFTVSLARNGRDGLHMASSDAPDLIVLDVMLPIMDGWQVLRALRLQEGGADVPVIFLTARDEVQDRVKGLELGADDYLVKPFDLDELLARIRALLRRRVSRSRSVIEHGALTLDLASHDVTCEGAQVKLAPREFSVLRALLDHPGKVVSKRQLSEKLYGWDSEVESNTVDVYVYQLRKKLGADCIQTVRGVGYKMRAASC